MMVNCYYYKPLYIFIPEEPPLPKDVESIAGGTAFPGGSDDLQFGYEILKSKQNGTLYLHRHRKVYDAGSEAEDDEDDACIEDRCTLLRVDNLQAILHIVCCDAADDFEDELRRGTGVEPFEGPIEDKRRLDAMIEDAEENGVPLPKEVQDYLYDRVNNAIARYAEWHLTEEKGLPPSLEGHD